MPINTAIALALLAAVIGAIISLILCAAVVASSKTSLMAVADAATKYSDMAAGWHSDRERSEALTAVRRALIDADYVTERMRR